MRRLLPCWPAEARTWSGTLGYRPGGPGTRSEVAAGTRKPAAAPGPRLVPEGAEVTPARCGQRAALMLDRLGGAEIGEAHALLEGPACQRAVDEPGVEDVPGPGRVPGLDVEARGRAGRNGSPGRWRTRRNLSPSRRRAVHLWPARPPPVRHRRCRCTLEPRPSWA